MARSVLQSCVVRPISGDGGAGEVQEEGFSLGKEGGQEGGVTYPEPSTLNHSRTLIRRG